MAAYLEGELFQGGFHIHIRSCLAGLVQSLQKGIGTIDISGMMLVVVQTHGLLVDMGNFMCVDEDPAMALGRLMPYAFHVHAKDFHIKSGMLPNPGSGWFKSRAGNYLRGAIIGHGDVSVVQCLQIMKRTGYEGTLSIEFEGMEDVLEGIAIGLSNLKRFTME